MLQFGFKSMEEIKNYLGIGDKPLDYDIALLDIDSLEVADNFDLEKNYKNCFVTAFDLYSLKKGVEILGTFKKPEKLYKVLFSRNLLKEENEYLDYLSSNYKVAWDSEIFSFPIELGNYSVMIENQIISRIKIKKLSDHYKNSLMFFMTMIFEDDIKSSEFKKIMKSMEKV